MAKRKRDKQGGVICLAAHVIKELLIRNPVDLFFVENVIFRCGLAMICVGVDHGIATMMEKI
jgi:hypothetical protein